METKVVFSTTAAHRVLQLEHLVAFICSFLSFKENRNALRISKSWKPACDRALHSHKTVTIDNKRQLEQLKSATLFRPTTVHFSVHFADEHGAEYIATLPKGWLEKIVHLKADSRAICLHDLLDCITRECPKLTALTFTNVNEPEVMKISSNAEYDSKRNRIESLQMIGYELQWFPNGLWSNLRSLRLEHCFWLGPVPKPYFALQVLTQQLQELGLPRFSPPKTHPFGGPQNRFTTSILGGGHGAPFTNLRLLWAHFNSDESRDSLTEMFLRMPQLLRCYMMLPNCNLLEMKAAAEALEWEMHAVQYPKGYIEDEAEVKQLIAAKSKCVPTILRQHARHLPYARQHYQATKLRLELPPAPSFGTSWRYIDSP